MKAFRSSASFGKRHEYIAIAELLRRDFDVYMTLVDDQQIDCIVRRQDDRGLRYFDIQIKARSKEAKQPGHFGPFENPNPRSNYFFIFFAERANCYWVIPSTDLAKLANSNKSGKGKGKYSVNMLNETEKTGHVRPRPKFKAYEGAFHLIT